MRLDAADPLGLFLRRRHRIVLQIVRGKNDRGSRGQLCGLARSDGRLTAREMLSGRKAGIWVSLDSSNWPIRDSMIDFDQRGLIDKGVS